MNDYTAPIRDMEFVLNELVGLEAIQGLPGYGEITPDLVRAVLEESNKIAREVLAPLNQSGDRQGARFIDGEVRMPEGWQEAYRTFVEGGWCGLSIDPKYGGQGLPKLVAMAVQEMWKGANLAFSLCPMLTFAAADAILRHGTEQQKETFLPYLVSGRWTGTMNLTEAQAGSDLSAIRTQAVRQNDHYLLTGQKIFITYGEHDLTDNIIHLVLARTPDAPAGVKGLSLFIVPKFKVSKNGQSLEPNDIRCVSLEHKMGIHASPTCVLAYGDRGGAVAYRVGEENRGLEYMFTMMNGARLAVGLEGVGIAEGAYQKARDYAKERVQGRLIGQEEGARVTIIHHPDVRRMLMTMKSQIEAMRALAYSTAALWDQAEKHPDLKERQRYLALVELLTPVVKGWCTELGVEVASLAIQVHGGMGYIEETGIAQYLRDARITTIYEGTSGIQANDLIRRKILRDDGKTARRFIKEMRALLETTEPIGDASVPLNLERGLDALAEATDWLLRAYREDPRLPAAASMLYLRLLGTVAGGWLMAKSAMIAQRKIAKAADSSFYRAKQITAQFYLEQIMPQASSLLEAMVQGSGTVLTLEEEQF